MKAFTKTEMRPRCFKSNQIKLFINQQK